MLNLAKRNVVLMVFTKNKLCHFSKRALRAGTARNKWLKEALLDLFPFLNAGYIIRKNQYPLVTYKYFHGTIGDFDELL